VPHQLLLADDSVTIQRVIKLTFADEDVDVLAVGDGDQAVAAIEKAPPDIVLADVAMPGRTGYEVARHIRNTPRLAHIPVVLLTGAFEPVDEVRASEVGCDGVLAKPFEPEAVVTRVKELLSRPRGAGSTLYVAPPPAAPSANQVPSAVPRVPPAAPAPPTLVPMVPRNSQPGPPQAANASLPAPQRPNGGDVDEFLERLDQAIATRVGSPRSPRLHAETGTPSAPVFATPAPEPSGPRSLIEAFEDLLVAPGPAPVPAPVPLPIPHPSSPNAVPQSAAAMPVPSGPVGAGSQQSPPSPVSIPTSVVSAIAAGGQLRPVAAVPPGATGSLSSAQMDELAEQVMSRLTARLNGATFADVVSQVAERVVREEIEKIKRRV